MAGIKPIQIEGMENAIRQLKRVHETLAAEKLRPILLEGAEVFKSAAQANAPVDTGSLKNSIVAKLSTRRDAIVAYMAVDMTKISKVNRKTGKKIRYPYFQEYGTPLHRASRYFRRAISSKTQHVKTLIESKVASLLRKFS